MSEELELKPSKAESLVNNLRKGKKLHDEFGEVFEARYKMAGRLMSEWKKHFNMSVPPDLAPGQCREYGSKIMELYQEANFYKLACEARLQSLKGNSEAAFREAFAKLVAQYKENDQKLPAKDTLTALANEQIGDIQDALVHADIELSFWKGVLNNLDICRKIVDTISISLSVEAKALQQERYLDGMVFNKHERD